MAHNGWSNEDVGPAVQPPLILVVDDEPLNLELMVSLLEPLQADLRVAANGQSALSLARLAPTPDLILLDIMMPDMDGYAVLAELKKDPATQDIPVIFLTAMDSAGNEERGLNAGATDYITKPVHPRTLLARARAQIELKRSRDLLTGQKAWLEQEVVRRMAENTQLETRLKLALEAAGFGIWEHRHDSGLFTWSPALCALLGLEVGPETMADFLALAHQEDRPTLERDLIGGETAPDELHAHDFRLRHRDGHWLWVEARGRIIRRDPAGAALLTVGTMADISPRKASEADQRLTAMVFRGISDGICVTDPACRILLTNEAFTSVTGYDSGEVVGRNPSLLRSGVHGSAFYRDMWETIERYGNWQGEITNRRKDGALVNEWLSISAVRDSNGEVTHYVGVFSDLSERRAAIERIQYLSSYDPLTDLPNRNLFADRLAQALMSARRFERETAVILLDLDRFRFINDTLGPPVGDQILVEVARRLSLQVREGDTVGRRSGNEFGFVMAHLSHEQDAIALAQRMLDAIAVPFDVSQQSLVITASIGISLAPRDGTSPEELLKCADAALIRAKAAGRNTFRFYSPKMDADAARRLSIESGLREALAQNELSVFYQPQISLESGNVIGMEALLRWHSGLLGAVSPAEFIPIAEETGLIIGIGEWVLHCACAQAKAWLDLGLQPLRVAVNLSARQFRQTGLTAMVAEALARSGLPPAALELEITESAFIDDVDEAVALCRALKSQGVKLSLDDFGTGYSSLAYISRFPFDKLKIDQSFVRDIIENPVNAAIATAAIVMARSLNLSVLAEGVETEAQASFLRSRRCDAMQGFLFSRPLPADQFATLLLGNKRLPVLETTSDHGQTLLIVDDEPNILASLSRLLRREGYRILTATNATDAFGHLAKHPVQVILSDQRMPGMSGTEFLSRVRRLYPETVRIVLTGYTDLESVTGAINRGAIYKFLTKPWDDDQLRDQVREAFRLAKDLQPQAETSEEVGN